MFKLLLIFSFLGNGFTPLAFSESLDQICNALNYPTPRLTQQWSFEKSSRFNLLNRDYDNSEQLIYLNLDQSKASSLLERMLPTGLHQGKKCQVKVTRTKDELVLFMEHPSRGKKEYTFKYSEGEMIFALPATECLPTENLRTASWRAKGVKLELSLYRDSSLRGVYITKEDKKALWGEQLDDCIFK